MKNELENKLNYKYFDNIPIGIYNSGPVGISVSCGADSAIILYVLMKYVDHDIHIFNLIAEYRKQVLEEPFDRVVEKCAELTGKKNYYIHKHNVPKPPPELMFQIWTDYLDKGIVDIVYSGLTKHPPEDVYEDWEEKLPEWHRKTRQWDKVYPEFGYEITIPPGTNFQQPPLSIDGKPKDKITMDNRAYSPLVNHDKTSVATLYKELDVLTTLYPVTRSCENDNHPNSHCGKCWWCGERAWAFGHLE